MFQPAYHHVDPSTGTKELRPSEFFSTTFEHLQHISGHGEPAMADSIADWPCDAECE